MLIPLHVFWNLCLSDPDQFLPVLTSIFGRCLTLTCSPFKIHRTSLHPQWVAIPFTHSSSQNMTKIACIPLSFWLRLITGTINPTLIRENFPVFCVLCKCDPLSRFWLRLTQLQSSLRLFRHLLIYFKLPKIFNHVYPGELIEDNSMYMVLFHQFLLFLKTMTDTNQNSISTIDHIKTRLSTNLTKGVKHKTQNIQIIVILIFTEFLLEAFLKLL